MARAHVIQDEPAASSCTHWDGQHLEQGEERSSSSCPPPAPSPSSSSGIDSASPSPSQDIFRCEKLINTSGEERILPFSTILTSPSSSSEPSLDDTVASVQVCDAYYTDQVGYMCDTPEASDESTKVPETPPGRGLKGGGGNNPRSLLLRQILSLSACSVLGVFARVLIGNLFGGRCGEGNSPWREDMYHIGRVPHLCITSGDGALFTDLPANMLGCFLAGLLQPARDLGLPDGTPPVAFLPVTHWFQRWHVAHLALRIGFFGALTTFASWNSQMVAMMVGSDDGDGGGEFRRQSPIGSALFGYVLGLEAALASLALGRSVAVWSHRYANPRLARAMDVLLSQPSQREETAGKPRIEPDIEMQDISAASSSSVVSHTEFWDERLRPLRTCAGGNGTVTIEGCTRSGLHLLLDEVGSISKFEMLGDATIRIVLSEQKDKNPPRHHEHATTTKHGAITTIAEAGISTQQRIVQTICIAFPVVSASSLIVFFGISSFSSSVNTPFHRTMWTSLLLAPFGTLLRWRISSMNETLRGKLAWFPLGTFVVNIVASLISVATMGLLLRQGISDGWRSPALAAVKTGLAGTMSTVSSFVVEGDQLQRKLPPNAKGYYYMIGSLVLACVAGLCIHFPLVRLS